MFNREVVENKCKELNIPIEKFYKEGNELFFGGFRAIKESEEFVKIFVPYLQYEEIKADTMTMEELEAFYSELRECKYIVGWFVSFSEINPRLWFAMDEEYKDVLELAGGLSNLITLSKNKGVA